MVATATDRVTAVIPGFDELVRRYTDDARSAFVRGRDAHPHDNFYAYALCSDDGAMTVVPCANSEQGLQRTIAEYVALGYRIDAPPETATPGADDKVIDTEFLRWCANEWPFWFDGDHRLHAEAYSLHTELHDHCGDDEQAFSKYRDGVFQLMVECLKRLDEEGLFGHGAEREKVAVMMWISDSEACIDWCLRSLSALNNSKAIAQHVSTIVSQWR